MDLVDRAGMAFFACKAMLHIPALSHVSSWKVALRDCAHISVPCCMHGMPWLLKSGHENFAKAYHAVHTLCVHSVLWSALIHLTYSDSHDATSQGSKQHCDNEHQDQ